MILLMDLGRTRITSCSVLSSVVLVELPCRF